MEKPLGSHAKPVLFSKRQILTKFALFYRNASVCGRRFTIFVSLEPVAASRLLSMHLID